MFTDCVNMKTVVVDFKVDPIESKGLHEPQDAFSEEGINACRRAVLIQDGKDRVAEDKAHESIISLGAMFNIDSRPEIEVFVVELAITVFDESQDPDQGQPAKHVKDQGYEYQW